MSTFADAVRSALAGNTAPPASPTEPTQPGPTLGEADKTAVALTQMREAAGLRTPAAAPAATSPGPIQPGPTQAPEPGSAEPSSSSQWLSGTSGDTRVDAALQQMNEAAGIRPARTERNHP